jgi:hypothetical protein
MAWISITDDTITSALSGPEIDALRTAALESGQDDPMGAMLEQVARLIRGKCAAGSIVLGDGLTIPDELISTAQTIVRWEALTRLPGVGMLQDDARRLSYEKALKLLDDVTNGKFYVVPATTAAPDEEQAGGPAPLFEGRTRFFN